MYRVAGIMQQQQQEGVMDSQRLDLWHAARFFRQVSCFLVAANWSGVPSALTKSTHCFVHC
jgi:hypothetical protein